MSVSPSSDEVEGDDDSAFESLLKDAFALPVGPGPFERGALLRCLRCGRTGRSDTAACAHDGGPMVPDGDARIGELVGSYRILECLGSGGAGTVYRARHRTLGREAAIKFLRPELAQSDEFRARLAREAQIIGQLDHEHVVRVIDYLTPADSSPILIMEFIGGRTLAQALTAAAEGGMPFEPGRAVHIACQIAQALARAHGLGVLHRDIKPSNVLLTRLSDDEDFVKVLDFGIARPQSGLSLTQSTTVVGTPRYMSPEQARRGELGPQSDLYSLGCVLFEMLCGRPPFVGAPAIVMHDHVHTAPPPLQSLAPHTPAEIVKLIDCLLDKSPARRFRDAHHLLSALQEILPTTPLSDAKSPSPSTPASVAVDTVEGFPVSGERELDRRLGERLAECELQNASPRGPEKALISKAHVALSELAVARAELDTAARLAVSEERPFSDRRRQVGRALDALGCELSTETALVQLLADKRRLAAGASASAVEAVCETVAAEADACISHGYPLPDARTDLDALRSNQLQRAAAELAGAEVERRAAEAGWQAGCQRRDDLAFQVDQLRGRLASLQVEAKSRNDATQARLAGLYAQQQACLEAAAQAIDRAATE